MTAAAPAATDFSVRFEAPVQRVYQVLMQALYAPHWLPSGIVFELRGSMAPHSGAEVLVELGPIVQQAHIQDLAANHHLNLQLGTEGRLHLALQPLANATVLHGQLWAGTARNATTGFGVRRQLHLLGKALRQLGTAVEAQLARPLVVRRADPRRRGLAARLGRVSG